MPTVPEEIVEATWRSMGAMKSNDAWRAMEAAGKSQPALLMFVMAYTEQARPVVQELAVYLYVVVLKMFQEAVAKRLKTVKPTRVEHHLSRNEDLLEKLAGSHDRFLKRFAADEVARQPHVLRYVFEAISEAPADEPEMSLTDEEFTRIYLTLKTTIDALDEACSTQPLKETPP